MVEKQTDSVESGEQLTYEQREELASAYAKNYVRVFIGGGLVFLLLVGFGIRTVLRNRAIQSAIDDRQWQRVLELDRNNVQGLLGRSRHRSISEDFDGALEDLNRASALGAPAEDVKQAEGFYFIQQATSHAKAGKIHESLEDLKAAQELGTSRGSIAPFRLVLADAYMKRCVENLRASKFTEAMADLKEAKVNNKRVRTPSSVALAVTGASVRAFEESPTVENRDSAIRSIHLFRQRHVDIAYYREPGPAGAPQDKHNQQLRKGVDTIQDELIESMIDVFETDNQILELKQRNLYTSKGQYHKALLARISELLQPAYDKSIASGDKERAFAIYGQILRIDYKRAAKAKQNLPSFPTIKNSLDMDLVFVSPASFRKRHLELTIPYAFRMSAHEVTQATYEKVMGVNPSLHKAPRNPVDSVSWEDAVEFCRRLSDLPEEKEHGRVYRLPNEAEWEMCCRGGIRWHKEYNRKAALPKHDWFEVNSDNKSHMVGEKRVNPWGFFDFRGNVSEWCDDWYWPKILRPLGPEHVPADKKRVVRGGNYTMSAADSVPERRAGLAPSARHPYVGFRIATSTLK